MNYRKAMNTKKKITKTLDSLVNATKESTLKAKETINTQGSEWKEALKNKTYEVKENISQNIQNKLIQDFKKNYIPYAIDYVNEYIISAFAKDEDMVTISRKSREDIFDTEKIMRDIATDMIPKEFMVFYLDDEVLDMLYFALKFYFRQEEQLELIENEDSFSLKLIVEESPEDETTKVTEDDEDIQDNSKNELEDEELDALGNSKEDM